jgi:hypothetical protein
MKTLKDYISESTRRGFLKGLASFAASAAVPAPVVKLLSTPAGVASLPIPAGIALLKGIRDHLSQWGDGDDDDFYEAQEDMAEALGFEEIEDDDGDDKSATDQMFDLLDLHQTNPELAAAQLIKHLQSKAVSPADVKSSFTSRADDPADWRYQNKMSKDAEATPPGSTPADIARLAGIAKGAVTPTDQAPSPTVKDMGPVQYAKDTPALPAPTKPEIDLTPNLKQKDSSNLKKL